MLLWLYVVIAGVLASEAFLRGLSPRVDYRELDGVSHFLMLDAPEAFDAALLGVLESQGFLPPARPR